MTPKTLGALAALLLFAAAPACADLSTVGNPAPGDWDDEFLVSNVGSFNLIIMRVTAPPGIPFGTPAFGDTYPNAPVPPPAIFVTWPPAGPQIDLSWNTLYQSPTLASAGGDTVNNLFWFMYVNNGSYTTSFTVDLGVFDVTPAGPIERMSAQIDWTGSGWPIVQPHQDAELTAVANSYYLGPDGTPVSARYSGPNGAVPAPAALLLGLLGLSGLGFLTRRSA
jgi:hypothetical protein